MRDAPKGESNCSHKAKKCLVMQSGNRTSLSFRLSQDICMKLLNYRYPYSLEFNPGCHIVAIFLERKGGKDILRFPIKGDDSVNRVNNSVVELPANTVCQMIVDKPEACKWRSKS